MNLGFGRAVCLLLALGLSRSASSSPQDPSPQPAEPLTFIRDVVPAITKAGCNAGACHGSFQGRGGLTLSLLGFDPRADYEAIAVHAFGRRVFPAAPDRSLILLKPSAGVPHGGGQVLTSGSPAYRVLRQWIARGLTGPRESDPRLQRIEVTPSRVLLKPGRQARLRVKAHWTDGVRDVTPWALFESSDDVVAKVAGTGDVDARMGGRAAIMVRYAGQVAAVQVNVVGDPDATPAWPAFNPVDDFIAVEWKTFGLRPAPLADDAEFIRRASLDLTGSLPSPDDIRRFLSDTDPLKRSRLIDELLERPEYVDLWSLKWGDLLRVHRRNLGIKGLTTFSEWIRRVVRENWPADEMVRDLLTAQGNLYTHGPVAFYYIDQAPQDLAETTAQVFLGVRLGCARCHHHPFEVWSQEDYYGLAAFFARVERKDTKENGSFGGAQSVRLAERGELRHPGTGKAVEPRVLAGPPVVTASDPRVELAKWVTSPENSFFARNLVNRYWSALFGRGLVEPVDDLRTTNPASHPELLDALAREFVLAGYDLKQLLRTLANSRTYQLACSVPPERDAAGAFFTHRRPRQMPAEVLLDAVNQAAGVEEKFSGLNKRDGELHIPPGTKAIALRDPGVASAFLDAFGRPQRTTPSELERESRPNLNQVLNLANGETLHRKISDPNGRVARLVASGATDDAAVEELYLSTLSRPPAPRERDAAPATSTRST